MMPLSPIRQPNIHEPTGLTNDFKNLNQSMKFSDKPQYTPVEPIADVNEFINETST